MLSCDLPRDPPLLHARAQPALDVPHALLRALEAHGPAQLLGLAAREAGHGHGHAQELLLEERHPQGALQDRLERRVRVAHLLLAVPPAQVGMDHLPHDGPGADDRHLHHEVVEVVGLHARQGRHLRAALHLEEAHGVGLAAASRRPWGSSGGRWARSTSTPCCGEQLDRVLERRHHARGPAGPP